MLVYVCYSLFFLFCSTVLILRRCNVPLLFTFSIFSVLLFVSECANFDHKTSGILVKDVWCFDLLKVSGESFVFSLKLYILCFNRISCSFDVSFITSCASVVCRLHYDSHLLLLLQFFSPPLLLTLHNVCVSHRQMFERKVFAFRLSTYSLFVPNKTMKLWLDSFHVL